ncbi:hypothetical protein WICPIJ_000125 [Wickerhamomyces pijperi]|uniref:Uncharacterized protein n=1 Tax=Wickerhamomyces pijperi TaxID=599730 RepID=A0A9P8TSB9_WICPI|nr:hypothetical protein WICPIJ_000125 [Wickerhamomyces pijperi]
MFSLSTGESFSVASGRVDCGFESPVTFGVGSVLISFLLFLLTLVLLLYVENWFLRSEFPYPKIGASSSTKFPLESLAANGSTGEAGADLVSLVPPSCSCCCMLNEAEDKLRASVTASVAANPAISLNLSSSSVNSCNDGMDDFFFILRILLISSGSSELLSLLSLKSSSVF